MKIDWTWRKNIKNRGGRSNLMTPTMRGEDNWFSWRHTGSCFPNGQQSAWMRKWKLASPSEMMMQSIGMGTCDELRVKNTACKGQKKENQGMTEWWAIPVTNSDISHSKGHEDEISWIEDKGKNGKGILKVEENRQWNWQGLSTYLPTSKLVTSQLLWTPMVAIQGTRVLD